MIYHPSLTIINLPFSIQWKPGMIHHQWRLTYYPYMILVLSIYQPIITYEILIAHPHHETSFLDSIFTRLPDASKEVLQVFALHPQMVQRMVAGRKCLPRESLGISTRNRTGGIRNLGMDQNTMKYHVFFLEGSGGQSQLLGYETRLRKI